MGGLLAAEAALDPSLNPSGQPKRVIGVIAFDTPFLGMHPHVVISGIASLLPKSDEKEKERKKPAKSEKELNQHPEVHVVEPKVTDDWEAFKEKIHRKSRPRSWQPSLDPQSYLDIPPRGPSPSPSSPPQDTASSISGTSSSQSNSRRSPSPFFDRALDFVASYTDPDDPLIRWFRKHSDDPLRATKRWILEKFQFGGCMFDPSGLKSRYLRLVDWEGGLWVNYWTLTVPKDGDSEHGHDEANDKALEAAGMLPPKEESRKRNKLHKAPKPEDIQKQKQKEKSMSSGHHFVVLPTSSTLDFDFGGMERWEKVLIAGVDDEVEAHTGLFKASSNLDYDAFVDRVADRVMGWCQHLHLGV
ncbi:hypothetical protein CC1G_11461 [Coprinopsis cinerea okayama7|uniref:Uncharacterized protein n=1 Tax=Coprinopsis cinerea (strain Okayama-7 / 130 / ATCC MYA-4618 / FGSC 9003) TaxID=240176 RepID=A8P040_COPC7|nr:hypothetical protein CC1G_11461 [Coprinopsis cinerea okayama7\|eukprot:XP_001837816.1 hypothetical protein CC1G_11461 [Coprinopsis cinerea okayama7\